MIKLVSDLGHATNTTDLLGITEILLKVALSALKQTTNNSILYNNLLIAHFYRFVTRVTQRMPHMEQKGLTLPEHMVYQRFGGVRVTHLFLSFLCCIAYFLFVCFCLCFCEGIALFFVFLYLVCSMLPVSLGCSFLIALLVFSKFLSFNEIHSIGSEKL